MSDAEKAWNEFAEKNIDDFMPAPLVGGIKYSFNSGWRARGAEVAELREQVAAAEATIEKVRELADEEERGALRWQHPLPVPEWVPRVRAILDAHRPTVLAEHDAEVAAQAVERARDSIMPPPNWNIDPMTGGERRGTANIEETYHDVYHDLSSYVAALRKGATNA